MGRVVVVGSLNSDHTVRVKRHPEIGQTVIGLSYARALGGKGFNQAVTAARQGADVVMVGCVGDDSDGGDLVRALAEAGADVGYVRRHAELPTGRAHITVDDAGRNSIVVVSGANAGVSFPSAALEGASVLLVQLEVPLDVVAAALFVARNAGVTTVLNPAPAQPLSDRLLSTVDYLMPNETEAQLLGEVAYTGTAIVTQGERGSLLMRPGQPDVRIDALHVEAVDTTAAGDAFCGCFAAALASGLPLEEGLRRANAAGAHAVTVHGALPSLPTAHDVNSLLG
jgi:ribokinase